MSQAANKKGGDQVIDAFREEVAKMHGRYGRALTQLHTRLVSGGVDVAQIRYFLNHGCHPPSLRRSCKAFRDAARTC